MTEEENEEGRAKALFYYRILALILGVLGGGMLTCGIIAASNVDDDIFGPPYFVGGFIVGIMALISAILSILIIVKASKSDSNLQKKELACVMSGQFKWSMFMIMGCFASTVLCGIGGFAFDNERTPLNQTLAIVIMVGNVVGLLVTISAMCILCAYGSYFGVDLTQRRTVVVTTNQGVGLFGSTTTTAHANVFQSDFGGVHMNMGGMNMGGVGLGAGGNSSRADELERQNQLLKEQLELQKQLNEQQQQQQQQYGGGFTQPPPPPPMYNIEPAYSPTVPPPCYDDVKH